MQPSDNAPTPAPVPKQPKQGFLAKLFGKKPTAPVVPPHESLAPPPQLDDVTAPAPTTGLDVTAAPNVDPLTGAPQATTNLGSDANGEVTASTINIPPSVAAPISDEPHSLPVTPSVGAQPQPPVQSQPPTPPQPPTSDQQQ